MVKDTLLKLAKELGLPTDVVTQKINVLGQSGGGKTYLAMKLAELMLEMPALITVIDLVGVWPGLLSSADGLHPGFPVLVIGGEKGHLPLNPNAGRLTADVVYDRDVSVVLDLSDLLAEDEEQLVVFLADFLEQLFLRHKRGKKRRHIFYEEAQEVFPETMSLKGHVRLRRIGTRLCKIGRNYGLGYTTITQEPQSTSKRILNQAGTLIAVRTIGELERKAVAGTARSAATQGLDLMNVLPELQTGEAIIWSPAWLRFSGKVHVLPKVTFDSSKTPDGDTDAVEPKVLAPVEVEQLRLAMASAIAQAEAEDPDALKRRVRELELQLAARAVAPPPPPDLWGPRRVHVVAAINALEKTLYEDDAKFADALKTARKPMFSGVPGYAVPVPRELVLDRQAFAQEAGLKPLILEEGKFHGLKRGARAMAMELVALHPRSLTRRELSTRALLDATSGSTGRYLKALQEAGLIENDENGDWRATAAALKDFRGASAKKSADLVAGWSAKFKRGGRSMLDQLLTSPRGLTREQLATATNLDVTSGSTGRYLRALEKSGCAVKDGRLYLAGPALFLGETR